MKRQVKELNFSGEKIYVGIDTHLKSWKVAIALEHSLQKVYSQEPSVEQLMSYLRNHYPNGEYHCVYEAGFCGFWIQERLTELGVICKVINAADVPTTDKEKRLKTDKRDCRKLARCLRDQDMEYIHIPSKQLQKDRSLVRTRYKIKRDVNRVKNRIVSHLYFYGIKEPSEFTRWTKLYINWLESTHSNEDMTLSLLVKELGQMKQLELTALRQLRSLSKTDRYESDVALLLTVPGIGLLTSILLLVEIGDIKRFKTLDELSGMVGIIPNTDSSGESERIGEMTKRGKKSLRTALIESSWVAIRMDPELGLSFGVYRKRMEPTKAIVRIARKLLNRIRRVLLTKEPYIIATA